MRFILLLASGCTLAALLTVGANAQRVASEKAVAKKTGLDDIVVTAQRTNQKLQDVPASVTAFTDEAIDRLQINTLLDVSRLVPNVKFDPVTGGSTGLKPYIRGGGVTDGGQSHPNLKSASMSTMCIARGYRPL